MRKYKMVLYKQFMRKLSSTGTLGLSTIMRACLSLHNRQLEGRHDIVGLFASLFPDHDGSDAHAKDEDTLNEFWLEHTSEDLHPAKVVGNMSWRRCEIETPISRSVFGGSDIFEDYWISLASGAAADEANPQSVIEVFAEAVRQHPRNSIYLRLLGDSYERACNYEAALVAYEKVREMGMEETRPHLLGWHKVVEPRTAVIIAQTCSKAGNYDKAIREWQPLIRQYPEEVGFRVSLGEQYAVKGDHKSVVAVLERAVQMREETHHQECMKRLGGSRKWKLLADACSALGPTNQDRFSDLCRDIVARHGYSVIDDWLSCSWNSRENLGWARDALTSVTFTTAARFGDYQHATNLYIDIHTLPSFGWRNPIIAYEIEEQIKKDSQYPSLIVYIVYSTSEPPSAEEIFAEM